MGQDPPPLNWILPAAFQAVVLRLSMVSVTRALGALVQSAHRLLFTLCRLKNIKTNLLDKKS